MIQLFSGQRRAYPVTNENPNCALLHSRDIIGRTGRFSPQARQSGDVD
jgi:hypothetical protein